MTNAFRYDFLLLEKSADPWRFKGVRELFDCWVCLTPAQKQAVVNLLKTMHHDNEKPQL